MIVDRYALRAFVLASFLVAACGSSDDSGFPRVELARNAEMAIVRGGSDDTWESLAADYLGSADNSWILARYNPTVSPPGQRVILPLTPPNPIGVYADGFQTVPVLCYHRFTGGKESGKLDLSATRFEEQMQYLHDNGYRVISFAALQRFVAGDHPVPPRSVIITIDDGYRSTYDIAYPILRKFGFPATVFVYTDFVGAPAALTWSQMEEMLASGLIDIQPHSKSHANLVQLEMDSGKNAGAALAHEVVQPAKKLHRRLGVPMHTFSYPYGATNDKVVEILQDSGFDLAATVHRGPNPAFAAPYRLRRAQIYSTHTLANFTEQLQVFRQVELR
jgi:peptidoglycan/xylan/chitin deacetylase (PgdA/CDA1 family)